MKLKNMLNGGLLAVSVTLLASTSAKATNSSAYGNTDWLLGFYSTGAGGTSTSQDYMIDLGPYSGYASESFPTSVTNIGADLTKTFGSNWYGNVYFGVIATNNVNGTLDVTNPDAGNPFASTSGLGTISNAIKTVGLNFSQQPQLSGMLSSGLIQAASTSNDSWYQFVANNGATNGALDGSFINDGGNGDFGDGAVSDLTSNSLEFDQIYNSNTATSAVIGSFSIDSSGDVTFSSTGAVPEPSTYAAVALGAAVLAFARRRRIFSV
jgi:hypothetical protein